MDLYKLPPRVEPRWVSFENPTGKPSEGGKENRGAKGHPFDSVLPGEEKVLLDIAGSGSIRRIWMTVSDRSPEMLAALRLRMYWDHSETPAVDVPFGDFFGAVLGRPVAFESALFSNPEGRSFNCFIPMPFRTAARVTLTNEGETPLTMLFYDIDLLIGEEHGEDVLYFHSRHETAQPNALGQDVHILRKVEGQGRFLGCFVGVKSHPDYEGAWWGEGEVKIYFGDEAHPTLCGTGTEDYIGTGWGQGAYSHRTQGCPLADDSAGEWGFIDFTLRIPFTSEMDAR